MTLSKPGYVYLMHAGRRYKIGASARPEYRIGDLAVGSSDWLSLVHKVFVCDMGIAEKALQRWFADVREHGEWFDLWPEAVWWFKKLTTRDVYVFVWKSKDGCKYYKCDKKKLGYGVYCSIECAKNDLESPYLRSVSDFDIADLWG